MISHADADLRFFDNDLRLGEQWSILIHTIKTTLLNIANKNEKFIKSVENDISTLFFYCLFAENPAKL